MHNDETLNSIYKILRHNNFTVNTIMTDYIQGADLWSAAKNLTDKEKCSIGKEIAQFLNELHSISGNHYDIGHYIPTVPGWTKSWKEGHLEYAGILKNSLMEMSLDSSSQKTIAHAFNYIHANIDSMGYQAGAKLLHNDFHPKNIIIHEGRLAGVIDWECSQFGESDFELSRLFDWCVYPDSYFFKNVTLRYF